MLLMTKKKPTGGKHQTPRKPVQLPAEWYDLAAELAADRMTPTAWLVIDLIRREAEAKGRTDLPALPWAVKPADDEGGKK